MPRRRLIASSHAGGAMSGSSSPAERQWPLAVILANPVEVKTSAEGETPPEVQSEDEVRPQPAAVFTHDDSSLPVSFFVAETAFDSGDSEIEWPASED